MWNFQQLSLEKAHSILGVGINASEEEVKSRYRILASSLLPDSKEDFQQVSFAFSRILAERFNDYLAADQSHDHVEDSSFENTNSSNNNLSFVHLTLTTTIPPSCRPAYVPISVV